MTVHPIEILMTDDFVKIKPTDPIKLRNKQIEGIETDPIPQAVHYPKQMPNDHDRKASE